MFDCNFSEWYLDIVYKAKLAQNSSVKGCIIVLPYGYALWENIQFFLGQKIINQGARNMAFPLLIPYSYFEKEKDHIEGFAPEVALVTSAGGRKLEDPLVVRPTSEVIIHEYFKNVIHSWRDLPIKVNQWCSVVRWEKRPRPFIRTTEFWWQEGHTAHAAYSEAFHMTMAMISEYASFCRDYLAIPVIVGKKPQAERFAGAEETWTIEGIMQDGKAVQMGTSHLLGKGFAEAAGIKFQDANQINSLPYLTSWGVTTRLIGTIVMVHGDKKGLVMPPYIAPIHLIIIPIYKNKEDNALIFEIIEKIKDVLFSAQKNLLDGRFRFEVDCRDDITPGFKFCDADLRGIPFRIDLGMRDLTNQSFTFYTRFNGLKRNYNINVLLDTNLFIDFILEHIENTHRRMYEKALSFKQKIIFLFDLSHVFCKNIDEECDSKIFQSHSFYLSYWCQKDYDKIKEKQLTVRCILSQEDKIYFSDIIKEKPVTCCIHHKKCSNLELCFIAKCY